MAEEGSRSPMQANYLFVRQAKVREPALVTEHPAKQRTDCGPR